MKANDEPRVLIGDTKVYALPNSLDDLKGPDHGTVFLRHSVWWAASDGHINIDTVGGIRLAYRAVINEGLEEDFVSILNPTLLKKVWKNLSVARRAQQLWEERFPERASSD